MNLHNDIMNLPCKPDTGWTGGEQYSYKLGHKDVRHAAAELALKAGKRIAELEAARMAYASEFPLNEDGEPDVGSIHANIRNLKAQLAAMTKNFLEA